MSKRKRPEGPGEVSYFEDLTPAEREEIAAEIYAELEASLADDGDVQQSVDQFFAAAEEAPTLYTVAELLDALRAAPHGRAVRYPMTDADPFGPSYVGRPAICDLPRSDFAVAWLNPVIAWIGENSPAHLYLLRVRDATCRGEAYDEPIAYVPHYSLWFLPTNAPPVRPNPTRDERAPRKLNS